MFFPAVASLQTGVHHEGKRLLVMVTETAFEHCQVESDMIRSSMDGTCYFRCCAGCFTNHNTIILNYIDWCGFSGVAGFANLSSTIFLPCREEAQYPGTQILLFFLCHFSCTYLVKILHQKLFDGGSFLELSEDIPFEGRPHYLTTLFSLPWSFLPSVAHSVEHLEPRVWSPWASVSLWLWIISLLPSIVL